MIARILCEVLGHRRSRSYPYGRHYCLRCGVKFWPARR